MGTPAYMAPEQRAGKESVHQTDIYSLGLVLYEMTTGNRPPHDQPLNLDALPEKLAHIIRRCLAKDPEDRWNSARDLKFELKWAGERSPSRLAINAPEGAEFRGGSVISPDGAAVVFVVRSSTKRHCSSDAIRHLGITTP
jgi:serine/threonine protein kinase